MCLVAAEALLGPSWVVRRPSQCHIGGCRPEMDGVNQGALSVDEHRGLLEAHRGSTSWPLGVLVD
eukprot:4328590-Pyramimonas_sp.AAC.1